MAPERGVTGIAAGRRETIGEAGVGWRRRTESWSMMGLCRVRVTGYLLSLAQLWLVTVASRGLNCASVKAGCTVYNRPFDRQTAFACETTGCLKNQCSASVKGAMEGSVKMCDSSCGAFDAWQSSFMRARRRPAAVRRAASHVSIENRSQQSNRSRLHLRRSKNEAFPPLGMPSDIKNSRVLPQLRQAQTAFFHSFCKPAVRW